MYEQRLMSIGYPFTDAFNICKSFRRDGMDLAKFVEEEEEKARKQNGVLLVLQPE